MSMSIYRAAVDHTDLIAEMVKELLCEIMNVTGKPYFNVEDATLKKRARALLANESNAVFLAANVSEHAGLGFVALFEGYALYAEGVFGVISELYVRPAYRSQGIGAMLLEHATEFGKARGWNRLEVTTPPLPFFSRTVSFYESHGFQASGGKKMNRLLTSS